MQVNTASAVVFLCGLCGHGESQQHRVKCYNCTALFVSDTCPTFGGCGLVVFTCAGVIDDNKTGFVVCIVFTSHTLHDKNISGSLIACDCMNESANDRLND